MCEMHWLLLGRSHAHNIMVSLCTFAVGVDFSPPMMSSAGSSNSSSSSSDGIRSQYQQKGQPGRGI